MSNFFVRLMKSTLHKPAPLPPSNTFKNQTVVVTGANTGLGFEAAKHFLSLQASHLILAVRSLSKGHDAQAALERETGKKGIITVMEVDVGDFESIAHFVERLDKEVGKLDVVVLNAGVFNRWFHAGKGGVNGKEEWEDVVRVNTLGTTAMAVLLMPILKKSAGNNEQQKNEDEGQRLPKMVLVSSGTHASITRDRLPADGQDLVRKLASPASPTDTNANAAAMPRDPKTGKIEYRGEFQYGLSKYLLMCNLPHLVDLAKSPDGTRDEVLVTSCCPGMVKSDLGRQYHEWWIRLLIWMFQAVLAKNTDVGARNFIGAAALGKDAQGGYWKNDAVTEQNPLLKTAEGKRISRNVWDETIGILKSEIPEIRKLAHTDR